MGPGWVLFARGVYLRNSKGELVSDARDDPVNLDCRTRDDPLGRPGDGGAAVGAHGVRRERHVRTGGGGSGRLAGVGGEEALPADAPSGVGLRPERPQEPALGEVVGPEDRLAERWGHGGRLVADGGW